MRELSLYIHIPFCVRKCLYCDFLSFPVDDISYVNQERAREKEGIQSGSYVDKKAKKK